jgi:hypothetical protein
LNLNNYAYSYTAETNRLASITNSVGSNTGIYNYDAIGNVIKDEKQNVSSANWNVYGKLQSATKTNGLQINYAYNPSGNRIQKVVGDTSEFYVRDASGNILAVYKKEGSGILKQTEINIYGSSMIGNVSELSVLPQEIILQGGFASGILKTFTRGEKEYLLTDHRANNMVTVSDRRQQYSVGGTTVDYYLADIKTASYYSSFGAISNSYNSNLIKYGFNGQRRSTEISGFAQTAEFWEYNGDVGRRWNLDVKPTVGVSEYSTFGNNPISNIDILGDTSGVGTRAIGALKVIGGAAEMTVGAVGGVAVSWTGIGALAGGAAVMHGADVTSSGLAQLWTGKETTTLTQQGISKGLQAIGVSKPKAEFSADIADAGIGILLSAGAGMAKDGTLVASRPLIQTVGAENQVVQMEAQAAKGQTIIGEGMKRVSMEATKHEGSVILNNMPKFTGTADQITSQMMTYNRQWILQQMRSGKPILDIGLDATRTNPSIFYQMEQNMMKNYLKIHPNAFQIIKP